MAGRAQTGFDPNRQRTNVNPAAHRMLNGAIRGSHNNGGGMDHYGGGRGGNHGGFYDQRNRYAGNHDGRRSYNEERDPPRHDDYQCDSGYGTHPSAG